jgi:hypothetical protein
VLRHVAGEGRVGSFGMAADGRMIEGRETRVESLEPEVREQHVGCWAFLCYR